MNVGLACSNMIPQVCVCLQTWSKRFHLGWERPIVLSITSRRLYLCVVPVISLSRRHVAASASSLHVLGFHVSTSTSQGLAHVYYWRLIPTMASNSVRFATKAAVLLGLALGIKAVPSVNVALKTSFGAPPYLVELLYVWLR